MTSAMLENSMFPTMLSAHLHRSERSFVDTFPLTGLDPLTLGVKIKCLNQWAIGSHIVSGLCYTILAILVMSQNQTITKELPKLFLSFNAIFINEHVIVNIGS